MNTKKVLKRVVIIAAALAAAVLMIAGIYRYVTAYKTSTVDVSYSPDGKYELLFQSVGEPDWPFGSSHARLILKNGHRTVARYGFDVANDGKTISPENWRVSWETGFVQVSVSGEEQSDTVIDIGFDGQINIHDSGTSGTDAPEASVGYNLIAETDPEEISGYEDTVISAMLAVKDIFVNADKGGAVNAVLSDETVREMLAVLGSEGYSAIDYYGNLNMTNPDRLISFGKQVSMGQNAQAVYLTLMNDGSIDLNELSYRDGTGRHTVISAEWGADCSPRIFNEGMFVLNSISYTEKGWLILDRDLTNYDIDKKFNIDPHTMIRVAPYDETCRLLCDRYIRSVGYFENDLFTVSWNETDFGELDFNCLYPILYGLYFNENTLNMNSAGMLYGMVEDTALSLVPEAQYEEVSTAFFNISPDTLRSISDYSREDRGYYLCGYQTGYYSVVPRIPEPEAVALKYNDDGTLTLTVDAVYPWYGTDRAFTHETTIRETETGFQYVSNYVYESQENIFPELILRAERHAQVRQLQS